MFFVTWRMVIISHVNDTRTLEMVQGSWFRDENNGPAATQFIASVNIYCDNC
ncbi:MAG: hypothetical protein ACM3Q2_06805 [Syntrophothermus sp.]